MADALEADWNQVHILPAQIEDWISADHSARYIRAFVDELDLKELGFAQYYGGGRGRPPYATSLLLRVWLYGYVRKIRSTRGLEQACKEQMGFIWLCGTLTPDHNSLWRFWKAHREHIKKIFLETLTVATRLDMVGFVAQALDGTKIQAACSSRGGQGKDGLESMLAKADQAIEELEAQMKQSQAEFGLDEGLPKALTKTKALREKIRAAQATIESGEAKYVQPLEPEARRMKMNSSNRNPLAYNAQAVVDSKNQIITAAQVVIDNNDSAQLDPMIDMSETNTGRTSEVILADGGYSCGDQLQQADAKNREVIMPLPSSSKNTKNKPYHTSCFTYIPEKNVVICPQGHELRPLQNRHKEKAGIKLYRSIQACKTCPVRGDCTTSKSARTIEIHVTNHAYIEAHREKMKLDSSREWYRERSGIVEPVFAWVKIMDQFNRWTVRGLENVQAQWQWICTAQNLRRIIKVWSAGLRSC